MGANLSVLSVCRRATRVARRPALLAQAMEGLGSGLFYILRCRKIFVCRRKMKGRAAENIKNNAKIFFRPNISPHVTSFSIFFRSFKLMTTLMAPILFHSWLLSWTVHRPKHFAGLIRRIGPFFSPRSSPMRRILATSPPPPPMMIGLKRTPRRLPGSPLPSPRKLKLPQGQQQHPPLRALHHAEPRLVFLAVSALGCWLGCLAAIFL